MRWPEVGEGREVLVDIEVLVMGLFCDGLLR